MKTLVFSILMLFSTMSFASDQQTINTSLNNLLPSYSSVINTLTSFDMVTWRRCWIGPHGYRHCRWGYGW